MRTTSTLRSKRVTVWLVVSCYQLLDSQIAKKCWAAGLRERPPSHQDKKGGWLAVAVAAVGALGLERTATGEGERGRKAQGKQRRES